MANFLVARGTLEKYNLLPSKDANTVYYIDSTNAGTAYDSIYLGEKLLASGTSFVDASIAGNVITLTRANGTTAKTIDLTAALNAVKGEIDAEIEEVRGIANDASTAAAAAQSAADSKVASVKATADKGIVVEGTATAPTIGILLDPAEGNAATLSATGLMVTIPEEVAYTGQNAIVVSDHAISLKLDGNDKVLAQSTDGLKAELGLTLDNSTGVLTLTGKGGAALATIDLPLEQILKTAEFDPSTNHLELVFNTTTGDQSIEVDLSELVDTYTAGNGLELSGTAFSVKKDPNSESYLTVSANGVKLDGVDDAISTAVDAAKSELNDSINTVKAYTVNTKAISTNPVLNGADIALTGYTKPAAGGAVAAGDTINAAIGKLEKGLESAVAGGLTSVAAGDGISVTPVSSNSQTISAKLSTDEGNLLKMGADQGLFAALTWQEL